MYVLIVIGGVSGSPSHGQEPHVPGAVETQDEKMVPVLNI